MSSYFCEKIQELFLLVKDNQANLNFILFVDSLIHFISITDVVRRQLQTFLAVLWTVPDYIWAIQAAASTW